MKEKQLIKEEPIQRMENFGARPKTRTTGKRPCKFCNALESNTQDSNSNNCGKKGHYARACKQRTKNN